MGTKGRTWRPVLVGACILAVLVGVYSFAPSRAFARQLLSIFRVNKFAVVEITPDEAQIEEILHKLEDSIFSTEPEVVADEPVVKVDSIEEASKLAGFEARMPSYLPDAETPDISVKGHTQLAFPFTREGLETLLQLADMDPGLLPDDLEGGVVDATVPAMVNIHTTRFDIIQAWNPTIEYPDGIDPHLFGEVGLRLLGLSPSEAQRFSQSIDWTTTLVLPIPSNIVEFREIEIAGERGVLLRHPRTDEDSYGISTLLWHKGDVTYALVARYGGAETLVQIAESMF